MSFNVLIVDDSDAMRSVIKKIVAMSGFKVDRCLEAANGREALETLAGEWVDVIISDINMPEINGLELLSILKKDELYKEIPVIMISTEGSNERIQEAYRCGALGYIQKPFRPEDVKRTLCAVTGVGDDGTYKDDQSDTDVLDF